MRIRFIFISLILGMTGCYDHVEAPMRPPNQLILKDQQLTTLPIIPPAITELYLSGNPIKNWGILSCDLRLLDIRNCQLETFPQAILKQHALTTLYLSNNTLSHLPNLDAYDKLSYLNVDHNRLTHSTSFPISLHYLRLNNNLLTTLPSLPPNLKRLYLRNNCFTTCPESCKDLPRLQTLLLSGNPITHCPDWLTNLSSLEELDLSHTNITHLPKDLTGWKQLRVLRLVNCPLPEVERQRIRAHFDHIQTTILF